MMRLDRVILVCLTALAGCSPLPVDPLPSWNDGELKRSIIDFTRHSSRDDHVGYIHPADRIAVFDLDGTLVVEQPFPIALVPVVEAVRAAAERDPGSLSRPGIKALLDGDAEEVSRLGDTATANVIALAYADRHMEEAAAGVGTLLSSAVHPRFGRPLTSLQYQPMLELIDFLRDHGYSIWISSGSPVNVTREISEAMFRIPRQNVLGSTLETEFRMVDGRGHLVIRDRIEHINDTVFKPVTIYRAIGRRPAFVAGNVGSGGDIAMMQFSAGRTGPSFQLLINHDDAEREYRYAESGNESLHAAQAHGFHVTSIKNDWRTVLTPAIK